MDVEIPVLAGYLNVPTQSNFSLNRISKKRSCHRYCLLFKSSRHGIERLEISESRDDKNPKIITLENCVKITQEPSPANLIQIVKKTGTLTLNTLTDEDLKNWVKALQTVAFRDKNGENITHAAIEEDNDLYCSSFGDGLFIVTLIPSDTSMRCNIEPKAYMLHLTASELQLKAVDDSNIIIAKWPYRFIRKYGYRDGKFTFEAGRKCSTGEGVFTLDHTNPIEVFRCMSSKMKSMKKLISGDSLNNIECGENQLSVAASMEAGSRSPLPPSPCNQHAADFEISTTQSGLSLRGFISSSDSLNNFSLNSNGTTGLAIAASPPIKIIPNKPSRKSSDFEKFKNYEPVTITTSVDPNKTIGSTVILKPISPEIPRKTKNPPYLPIRNENLKTERFYESIEPIEDAWKTRGYNDIKHTERIVEVSNDDDLADVKQRQQPTTQREKNLEKSLSVKSSKIIDIDIGEGGSCASSVSIDTTYDRLDFLSPNNKTSSEYKTIVTVTSAPNRSRCIQSTQNEYELIASPDIQPYRQADDSHLGYGTLRKSTTCLTPQISATDSSVQTPEENAAAQSNIELEHCNYNGLNYATISKPKRV